MAADKYKTTYTPYGGKSIDISEFISDTKWIPDAGDYAEFTFKYPHNTNNQNIYDLDIQPADKITVFNTVKNHETFSGQVIKSDFNGSVTCRDNGFYLKNPIYLTATKKRVDTILKKICSKCGIKYGGGTHTAKISVSFANKKASDCVDEVMKKLGNKTGKKYWVRFIKGKLTIQEYQSKAKTIKVFRPGQGNSFDCTVIPTDISGYVSMENYVDLVYAIHEKNSKVKAYAKASYSAGEKKYGKLQKFIETDSKSTAASDARKELTRSAQLDREYKCRLFASDEIVPGVRLKFDGSDVHELKGEFWVIDAEHELLPTHTVAVTLKRCKDDYVKATAKKTNTTLIVKKNGENSESSGTYYTYEGKLVNALFTAYYPYNNSMEGGYYDRFDNPLIATYLNKGITEVAGPQSVLKKEIQIKLPGTKYNNKVAKCMDTGGAIKIVNGVYHFDILMRTAAECNAFGRKNGKALIITKKIKHISNSGGSDMGNKIVKKALSYLGKNLNPGFYWCAWFVRKIMLECSVSEKRVPHMSTDFYSVSKWLESAKKLGRFHYANSGYIPSKGDVFIEKQYYNGKQCSHTGFVLSADKNGYTTIEGNSSNAVRSHRRTYSYGPLTGFYHPNYAA